MSQVGRHVTDAVDGILNGKRFLIHDRDPLFTAEFQDILTSVGINCVKLPRRMPPDVFETKSDTMSRLPSP